MIFAASPKELMKDCFFGSTAIEDMFNAACPTPAQQPVRVPLGMAGMRG
jgi:hypothetical protein